MSVLFNSGERSWLWWYFGVNVSTWRSQQEAYGIRCLYSGFWLLNSDSWVVTIQWVTGYSQDGHQQKIRSSGFLWRACHNRGRDSLRSFRQLCSCACIWSIPFICCRSVCQQIKKINDGFVKSKDLFFYVIPAKVRPPYWLAGSFRLFSAVADFHGSDNFETRYKSVNLFLIESIMSQWIYRLSPFLPV